MGFDQRAPALEQACAIACAARAPRWKRLVGRIGGVAGVIRITIGNARENEAVGRIADRQALARATLSPLPRDVVA